MAVFACVPLARAAEPVNINTADQATLETLNGVGPSKAQAIITYRTQNGPFATIEDIMNVSGIGTATFNNIKDYITVGGSGSAAQTSTASSSTPVQTQAQTQSAAGGPPSMTVRVQTDEVVTAGGGSFFEAQAYGADTAPIVSGVRFMWNFGDGVAAEGRRVFHTYAYPGRYSVLVTAAYNYSSAISRTEVDARAAAVSLVAQGDGSLIVRNLSKRDVDIGLWSLSDSGASFVVPQDTLVFAGEGVRFSPLITKLAGTPAAELLYPNGALAAAAQVSADSPLRGERVSAAQPRPAAASAFPASAPSAEQGELLGAAAGEDAPSRQSSGMFLPMLAALAGVLVVGIAGAHYASRRVPPETSLTAEGFDIE